MRIVGIEDTPITCIMVVDILILLSPSLLVFVVLVARLLLDAPPRDTFREVPQNAIVVDGSNVMHWGNEPSSKVLSRVLRSLEAMGYQPILFFDANVGYVLGDRYFDEVMMARIADVPEKQICVVSKGVVADEAILMFASDHQLRVVTNDKYRDWRVRFPHADKKGVLIGGTWRDGAVKWRGSL